MARAKEDGFGIKEYFLLYLMYLFQMEFSFMKRLIGIGLGLLLVVGTAILLWPEEPPPIEIENIDDTGMTRFETEALMREIGYVQ